MPHVGDPQRPIEGFPGEQDGARAAGEDGPLVLDGELLVDERAHEYARRFAVRAVEKIAPLRPRKDAGMQRDERDPFGLSAAPSEGCKTARAVLQRRDRDGARCLQGGARRHPVTSARSPRTYMMRRPIGFTSISSGSTVRSGWPTEGHQDAGLWNVPFASVNTGENWLAIRSDCRILFRKVATRFSSALCC